MGMSSLRLSTRMPCIALLKGNQGCQGVPLVSGAVLRLGEFLGSFRNSRLGASVPLFCSGVRNRMRRLSSSAFRGVVGQCTTRYETNKCSVPSGIRYRVVEGAHTVSLCQRKMPLARVRRLLNRRGVSAADNFCTFTALSILTGTVRVIGPSGNMGD